MILCEKSEFGSLKLLSVIIFSQNMRIMGIFGKLRLWAPQYCPWVTILSENCIYKVDSKRFGQLKSFLIEGVWSK